LSTCGDKRARITIRKTRQNAKKVKDAFKYFQVPRAHESLNLVLDEKCLIKITPNLEKNTD
jgi:hypothetical protein